MSEAQTRLLTHRPIEVLEDPCTATMYHIIVNPVAGAQKGPDCEFASQKVLTGSRGEYSPQAL
jgi:hypothetical protein